MDKKIERGLQIQKVEGRPDNTWILHYSSTPMKRPVVYYVQEGVSLEEVSKSVAGEHHEHVNFQILGNPIRDVNYKPKGGEIVSGVLSPTGIDPFTAAIIAVVTFVASAAIGYFLFKPPSSSFESPDQERLARITGDRNDPRKYQTVSLILGKRLVIPAYAANPYTVIRGSDEYYRMLLCLGYGPLKVENIKIGQTPLESFAGVKYALLDHYENLSTQDLREIWVGDVVEEGVGATLNTGDDWVVRNLPPNVDTASVEFFFPRGIYLLTDKGAYNNIRVRVQVEYQDPDTSQWISVPEISISSNSSRQRRASRVFSVPNVSQSVAVRCRKITPGEREPSQGPPTIMSETAWTKLRGERNIDDEGFDNLIGGRKPPLNVNGAFVKNFRPVILALEIKATDNLSGMIDNLNAVVTSCTPSDWNADWRDWPSLALQPTENPADCYRWLLQGPGQDSPLPNERINIDSLLSWRDNCVSEGWRISYEMDSSSTLLQELGKIAFSGRAEFSFIDGKYGVVEKVARTYPVQIFTPKNSWDFSGAREYPEIVDGVKFEWENEEVEYQKDEGYFFDPLISVENRKGKFNGLDLSNIPSHELAYKHSRFSYYENALRREAFKLTTDVEGLVCTRGDLVRIQNDILDIGLGSGRITKMMLFGSGQDPSLILDFVNQNYQINEEGCSEQYLSGDEVIELPEGNDQLITFMADFVNQEYKLLEEGDYVIQFRTSEGEIHEVISTYIGDGVWQACVPFGVEVGDMFVYGTAGVETLDCIVEGIEYGENLECHLTLSNYAPEIYERDGDFIPEYNSSLNERPTFRAPFAPSLALNEAGIDIRRSRMFIQVDQNSQEDRPVETTSLQFREVNESEDFDVVFTEEDSGWQSVDVIQEGEPQFILQPVQRGFKYQVRARNRKGILYSPFSDVSEILVDTSVPPAGVVNVSFTIGADGVLLTWDQVIDPDLSGYEIRTNTNVGDEDGLVDSTISTSYQLGHVPVGTTYYIYAKTRFDEYSVNAGVIVIDPPSVPSVGRVTTQTLDNTVLLSWDEPATIYPIAYYNVRRTLPDRITGFDDATPVGRFSGTFAVIPEQTDGLYTYYVQVVDITGRVSTPISTRITVDNPPDFSVRRDSDLNYSNINEAPNILFTQGHIGVRRLTDATLSLDFVNQSYGTFDAESGLVGYDLLAPVDISETWQDSTDALAAELSISPSAVTWQDEIDNYGPRYIHPVLNTNNDTNDPPSSVVPSYFEKIIDLFSDFETETLLSGTRVIVSADIEDVEDGVVVRTFISASDDGMTWDEAEEGTQAFFNNFRYVRIRMFFDTPLNNNESLVRIPSINLKLDVKQITDQGVMDALSTDVGGTLQELTKDFLDVESVVATPEDDTLEVFPVVIFEDIPEPSSFRVKVYDRNGNRVSTKISYVVRGV